MLKEKITKEEALVLCADIWNWVAVLNSDKRDAIMKLFPGSEYTLIENDCPCCHYVAQFDSNRYVHPNCREKCPLWDFFTEDASDEYRDFDPGYFACEGYCDETDEYFGSVYRLWREELFEQQDNPDGNGPRCEELAIMMRDAAIEALEDYYNSGR